MKVLIIVAPSNHHFIRYRVFMRLKTTESQSSSHNTTGSGDVLGGRTEVLGSRLTPNWDFHSIKERPHDRHGSTFRNHRDGWWGYYLWNRFGKTAFRFIYKALPTTLTPHPGRACRRFLLGLGLVGICFWNAPFCILAMVKDLSSLVN